jgi:hypothetical protein
MTGGRAMVRGNQLTHVNAPGKRASWVKNLLSGAAQILWAAPPESQFATSSKAGGALGREPGVKVAPHGTPLQMQA